MDGYMYVCMDGWMNDWGPSSSLKPQLFINPKSSLVEAMMSTIAGNYGSQTFKILNETRFSKWLWHPMS
jgi:hypothetical protein